jgi:hypothetical protein
MLLLPSGEKNNAFQPLFFRFDVANICAFFDSAIEKMKIASFFSLSLHANKTAGFVTC